MNTELLVPTDEHEDLRATVRKFLADKCSTEDLRRQADTDEGFDRAVWRQMAEQLGLQALLVPEEHDGIGQGPVESWVVFEELGRALYPGPFLATVALAATALLHADDPGAAAAMLPGIAAGETIATLAVAESDGRWDAGRSKLVSARREGDAWRIDGAKAFVIHGAVADLILLTAQADAGTSLFAVWSDAAGLTRTPLTSLDLTRRLATLDLAGTPARLVGVEGEAEAIVAAVYERALVAVAAEQAGGIARCLEISVDYAKTRQQFGAPIGSFQAVAHKCVDMLHESEFARAAAQYAAACDADGSPEFPLAARVAAVYNARAFRRVTTEMIQVHGGTGFTWEHDTHLYYRRAWSSQQLFGDPSTHFEAIAAYAGLG